MLPDVFSSERLLYEPLTVAHAPELFRALSDARVTAHLSEAPVSLEEFANEFATMAAGPPVTRNEERWINFAVRLQSSGDSIGRIQATCYGTWAEVAYMFGAAWWGQGYASEAMRWLHAHLSQQYGIAEFWAAVHFANTRSLALLARLKYRAETLDASRPLRSYEPGDRCFCHGRERAENGHK